MKNKLLHLILLILVCFTLTSCGSFFEEETKEILAVTSYVDQNGNTVLKITYTDETNFMVKSGVLNPKVTLKVKKGIGNVVTMMQNKISLLEDLVNKLIQK